MTKGQPKGSGQPDKPRPAAGIECRKCGCTHWFVIWKRARIGYAWRRIECQALRKSDNDARGAP